MELQILALVCIFAGFVASTVLGTIPKIRRLTNPLVGTAVGFVVSSFFGTQDGATFLGVTTGTLGWFAWYGLKEALKR